MKCVAALVPPLRRHHTSRLGPLLAPRVAEDRLLAEDDLLAEVRSSLRVASADDLLARNVDHLLVLRLGGRRTSLRLILLLHRRLPAEDRLLAVGHLLVHLLARATNQILRCDKSELPRCHAGSTLLPGRRSTKKGISFSRV